jgi:hypothetical protein
VSVLIQPSKWYDIPAAGARRRSSAGRIVMELAGIGAAVVVGAAVVCMILVALFGGVL